MARISPCARALTRTERTPFCCPVSLSWASGNPVLTGTEVAPAESAHASFAVSCRLQSHQKFWDAARLVPESAHRNLVVRQAGGRDVAISVAVFQRYVGLCNARRQCA
jgi:hypothetical protein